MEIVSNQGDSPSRGTQRREPNNNCICLDKEIIGKWSRIWTETMECDFFFFFNSHQHNIEKTDVWPFEFILQALVFVFFLSFVIIPLYVSAALYKHIKS